MNKSKLQKTGGCKAAHFTNSDTVAAYKARCHPRTLTETLDIFPTPFPIKEAQAVADALLEYEKAQMKRVTFTHTLYGGAK